MRTPGTLYRHADVELRFLLFVSESHYIQITNDANVRIFENSTTSLTIEIEYFWNQIT